MDYIYWWRRVAWVLPLMEWYNVNSSVDTLCNGCLDIKFPYSIEGCVTVEFAPKTIAEKFGNKFFMRRRVDGSLYLPCDYVYYAQVQGLMAILEVGGVILLYLLEVKLLLIVS